MDLLGILKKGDIGITGALALGLKVFGMRRPDMLKITLLLFLPVNIALSFLSYNMTSILLAFDLDAVSEMLYNGIQLPPEFNDYVIYYGVFMLVNTFFAPLGVIAAAKLVHGEVYGERVGLGQSLGFVLSRAGSFALATLIYCVCIGFASLLIIPGIYLGTVWYFYENSVSIGEKGPFAALGESARLVKGRFFSVLLMFALIFTLSFGISWFIYMIFGFAGISETLFGSTLVKTLVSYACLPLYCGVTLWYINIRLLKEQRG